MRQAILAVLFWAGLVAGAAAQSTEIEATIDAQVDAFLADDLVTAFGYASPRIRSYFRTPENFANMVREGYPMVWRPTLVRFLALREEDGSLWQRVLVTDADGVPHVLDYQMIELETGWKIDAVLLVPPPGVAA